MNHETLQALYALDIAEVGEEEAAKRWEYLFGNGYFTLTGTPVFSVNSTYRRKPGIPWPKVMVQDIDVNPETMFKLIKTVKYLVGIAERGCGRLIKDEETPEKFVLNYVKSLETKQEWPADAPEWANYMATDLDGTTVFYSDKPKPLEHWWERGGTTEHNAGSCPNWRNSLIERPKPVLKKLDWSKLRVNWSDFSRIHLGNRTLQSKWVAWNCDENTRGNPLPDGLVVEWYEYTNTKMTRGTIPWDFVTRFRIAGIQEGWE